MKMGAALLATAAAAFLLPAPVAAQLSPAAKKYYADFERLAALVGLELTVIGDWGHLRGQHMLRFTKPA